MRLSHFLTLKRGQSLFLPAHGRGNSLPYEIRTLLKGKPGIWDIPELPGFGGPTCVDGAVNESQNKAAVSLGAEKGWYGVNGATGLLQAALLAIAKPKEYVLMPRNVHRSIIQACILGDIYPVLFDLPYLDDRAHYLSPDYIWFKSVFKQIEKDGIQISAVVLINPTYQGYSSDLQPLIKLIHSKGLPVLVDEAHGAYFAARVEKHLPESAISSGADLVVHSLHKSSLGLVQTAALWLQGNIVDPRIVEKSIALFQTTSTSALLLASCEAALTEWQTPRGQNKLKTIIKNAKEIAIKLRNEGLPILENQDPLKLILHTSSFGINGIKGDPWFIDNGVIAELPEPGTITFCLGFADQRGLISILKNKWNKLLSSSLAKDCYPPFPKPPFSLVACCETSCLSAFRAPSQMVKLAKSVGRVSSEIVSPYPPGVPILLPGEKLDQERIQWMMQLQRFWPDQIPSEIMVVS